MNTLKKLTDRQEEIVKYVKKGFQDKEIATYLKISVHTVKTHLKNIYSKLEVAGRTELAGLEEWPVKTKFDDNIIDVSGLWLSKFEYSAFRAGFKNNYVNGIQYDLEYLEKDIELDFFTHKGENLFCSSNSKIKYFHDLNCYVVRNNLVGYWSNKKETRNIGCFQLYISNNGNIMSGKHLGNASDNSIQSGNWVWIRIENNSIYPDKILNSLEFNSFDRIDFIFKNLIKNGAPISINEISTKKDFNK